MSAHVTPRDERLVREIGKMRASVKRKLRELKQGALEGQRTFETQFKPLIEPLKDISEAVGKTAEPKAEPKAEPEVEPEQYVASEASGGDDEGSVYEEVMDDDDGDDPEVSDELNAYLRFLRTDTSDEADFTYGVHHDGQGWKMGRRPVTFIGNDIVVDGTRYEGTPGLFELIFKKVPDRIYGDHDMSTYKQLLIQTGAYKADDGSRVKSNRGYKYVQIVSKLIPSRKRQSHSPPHPSGKGLMMRLNASKIDYRYWDDPNELVSRLRLLMASREAGNTGHDGEIMGILEELKEARIIKDFGGFRL